MANFDNKRNLSMDAYQKINRLIKDQTDDNGTVLPIELTNITGTLLQLLNEDCLLELFSSNSLTPLDLCSLADTCKRFKKITQSLFPKDYGILCVDEIRGYRFKSNKYEKIFRNLDDVERILKNFGPHISTLLISEWDQDVLDLVAKYCRGVTLMSLEICKLNGIEGVTMVRMLMNTIFQRLLKLTIEYCDIHKDLTSADFNCDSLIELKISCSDDCFAILKHAFANLEIFTWDFSFAYATMKNNSDILFKFIRRHGHIKAIHVTDEKICSSGLLHVIDSTKITFDFHATRSLTKIKRLDLDFWFRNYSQYKTLLPEFVSLETMKISGMDMDSPELQIFDILSQLQNLRVLHLTLGSFETVKWTMLTQIRIYFIRTDLPNIIRPLINLEELDDRTYYLLSIVLSVEEFSEIVKIVERREHVLTLKCNFKFNHLEYCEKNQKVKLINLNDDPDDA